MSDQKDPNIVVRCGAEEKTHIQSMEGGDDGFLGKTVGFIRCAYKEEMDIKPEMPAVIKNGETGLPTAVDDTYIMKENDLLEFVWKARGEKGLR